MEVSFLQLLRYLCQRVEVGLVNNLSALVNNIREYIFKDYKPKFQKWILSFYFSVLKKKKKVFFFLAHSIISSFLWSIFILALGYVYIFDLNFSSVSSLEPGISYTTRDSWINFKL